jgi:hypothetical protein
MSEYLILIYNDEAAVAPRGGEILAPYQAFMDKWGASLRGGAGLEPSATASTVRDGVVTDGVFAETKEIVGGYYVIEAADLDEALLIAKEVPTYGGGVEVRPITIRS